MELTKKYLRELFDYMPSTGELIWKKKTSPRAKRTKIGSPAGCKKANGYIVVGIGTKIVYAHRVVWIMHNGPIPRKMVIDHIDRNGLNNKIENLRLVTQSINLRNQRLLAEIKAAREECIGRRKITYGSSKVASAVALVISAVLLI